MAPGLPICNLFWVAASLHHISQPGWRLGMSFLFCSKAPMSPRALFSIQGFLQTVHNHHATMSP